MGSNISKTVSEGSFEHEQCSLCGRQIPLDKKEIWHSQDSGIISLPRSSKIMASADTSIGELDICEECYINENHFDKFSKTDLREIHEQFGLEYQHRNEWLVSLKAFKKCAEISEDAEIWFEMGVSYKGLGNIEQARKCYSMALEIDPENHFALNNLSKLNSTRP